MPELGTVLVTGATGDIGTLLVHELVQAGVPLRVLVRRPDQVEDHRRRGIDASLGSLDDPGAVRRAMTGVSQLFLLAPNGPEQHTWDRTAIDAAAATGVEHVVRVSTSDASPTSAIPWARDHARADDHLSRSGLSWTRLAPGAFTKNLLVEAAAIRRGWLPQTTGHGATAWVDVSDIAAVAARVLTGPGLQGGAGDQGRTYTLTQDRPLSYPEVAEILTTTLGHRVRYLHLPAPVFYAGLRLAGTPRWMARGLVRQFVDVVRRGHDGGRVTSTDVPDLLGRPATTVADFARAHRARLSPAGRGPAAGQLVTAGGQRGAS
ncbi:NAD(P)H-binding protein [Aquipuribacter hungaricus]|uniref:NAD(P)H-binding protein n=1 Tax=Aquipuribacter hungaricus TaxID=545624 RepID=A0ABV7WDQ7_9MICO